MINNPCVYPFLILKVIFVPAMQTGAANAITPFKVTSAKPVVDEIGGCKDLH